MKTWIKVLLIVVVLLLAGGQVANAEIVTVPFASFGNGGAVINYDHNTGNGNVLRFRCINDSAGTLWFGVYMMDYDAGTETLLGEKDCIPGETFEQNVPGVTVRWVCIPYEGHLEWPPDCGLDMANYQFRARYSAP